VNSHYGGHGDSIAFPNDAKEWIWACVPPQEFPASSGEKDVGGDAFGSENPQLLEVGHEEPLFQARE